MKRWVKAIVVTSFVLAVLGIGVLVWIKNSDGVTLKVPIMHGDPTVTVPSALAKRGAYQLHDGDALPQGVVWADPNTIFLPSSICTTHVSTEVLSSRC